ncbi:MAG: FAD-dependent oxidoreductase [Betaproteobacteria bacterium]
MQPTNSALNAPGTTAPAEFGEPGGSNTDNVVNEGEDRRFPKLSAEQIERVATYGHRRAIAEGELLFDIGTREVKFFVVISGTIEVLRVSGATETLITRHGPGQFTGEVNILAGRPSLVRSRVVQAGEVIELDRDQLQALVQTDSQLSEIIMRAFIVRRVALISGGISDVLLLGSDNCAATLRVKEFLTRNAHPYTYVDLDRDADVQVLLDRFHVDGNDIPVLICRDDRVLRDPTNAEIAECLGLNETIDPAQVRDVAIVGAGPAGLAAAVYAASEGLDVLVLEAKAPGGQAGSSSKIENYLGFPTGISGQALAGRAFTQAEKFGAQVVIANHAVRLACDRKPYEIEMSDGSRVKARSVIIATGAEYRKPPLANLPQYEGAGVYYSATFMEAQLCREEEVVVVGAGNSAGQAVVFLAQTVKRVYMLVRGDGLAETMSRYLIRRIEQNPAIELHTNTEITSLEGSGHLEHVKWQNKKDGSTGEGAVRHVFLMTGAVPGTQWLDGCVVMDDNGFITTGPNLSQEDLSEKKWPLARRPHLLETSLPGIFAVGDVRGGNIKRVASAVGEGSISISFVHQVLGE